MAPKAVNSTSKVKTQASKSAAVVAEASQAGMTPALQKPEEATPMTPKNFRNHPDMENFFRFIYENDLRYEALQIIDEIIIERKVKKKKMASA